MTTTKVTGLTPSNVRALAEADGHVNGYVRLEQIGATFVVFPGDTHHALGAVVGDMEWLRANVPGVRNTRYQSLIAVRNKLLAATMPDGHKHVQEIA